MRQKNQQGPARLRNAALYLLLVLVWDCGRETPPANESIADIDPDAERVENVEILYSDSSIVRVRIKGPVMLRYAGYENPRQEFPKGIAVEFFDAGGQVTSILTAAYAVRYESKGLTILQREVFWKSKDRQTLDTPELTWDERQQLVFTNKFAVVTTAADTVYSHGFEATQSFKNIKLNGIDGTMLVEERTLSGKPPGN
jgi:LPS export ABC transporter protein LptC